MNKAQGFTILDCRYLAKRESQIRLTSRNRTLAFLLLQIFAYQGMLIKREGRLCRRY